MPSWLYKYKYKYKACTAHQCTYCKCSIQVIYGLPSWPKVAAIQIFNGAAPNLLYGNCVKALQRGRWGKLNQIWGSEYCELRATSHSKPSRVIRSILTFLLRNRWNWDICKYSELTIYTVSSSEIKIFCDLSQIETKLPLRVCLSEHLNLCVTKVLRNVLFCNSIKAVYAGWRLKVEGWRPPEEFNPSYTRQDLNQAPLAQGSSDRSSRRP